MRTEWRPTGVVETTTRQVENARMDVGPVSIPREVDNIPRGRRISGPAGRAGWSAGMRADPPVDREEPDEGHDDREGRAAGTAASERGTAQPSSRSMIS